MRLSGGTVPVGRVWRPVIPLDSRHSSKTAPASGFPFFASVLATLMVESFCGTGDLVFWAVTATPAVAFSSVSTSGPNTEGAGSSYPAGAAVSRQ